MMRGLVLLVLVSLPAAAQVAGLCGPGKNCKVRSLDAVVGVEGATVCAEGPNAQWQWTTGTSVSALGWRALGGACGSGNNTTNLLNFSVNEALVRTNASGGFVTGSGGLQAPLAFASFPVCSAGLYGTQLYDSTNAAWRSCKNTGWVPIGPVILVNYLTTYIPSSTALLNVGAARIQAPRQFFGAGGSTSAWGGVYLGIESATTVIAGVGAGNAVYTIHNVTDAAATTATVTVPCASVAGTSSSGSSVAVAVAGSSSKDFEIRLTTDGCTTLPVVNVTWGYYVTPPGS